MSATLELPPQKADRPDETERNLRLSLYSLGCSPRKRPEGDGWNVYHRGVRIGRITDVGGRQNTRHPWVAEPAVIEEGLPLFCDPRRSAELAVIALLNRHYRLLHAARQRAESQQEA